eukprot:GILJ01024875.1.p1 GENE.GILJ01024875.1~~GILJ01024875.1.p1  ORF type:complete len:249 (-),score=16.88 GILJ01024875.1:20-766(-)
MKRAAGVPWYLSWTVGSIELIWEDVNSQLRNNRVLIFEHLEQLTSRPTLHRSLCEIHDMARSSVSRCSQTAVLTTNDPEAYATYFAGFVGADNLSHDDAVKFLYEQIRDDPNQWYCSDLAHKLNELPSDAKRSRVLSPIINEVGTDASDLQCYAISIHMLGSHEEAVEMVQLAAKDRFQKAVDYVGVNGRVLNALPLQCLPTPRVYAPRWIKYMLDMEILTWDRKTWVLDFRTPSFRQAWTTISPKYM